MIKMAAYSSSNTLLPIWHGTCFSYNSATSDLISTFQTDHGEIGFNVQFSEDSVLDEIKMQKHMEYKCSHHAKTCTMPLHNPLLVSDISKEKEQLDATLKRLTAKICSKSKKLKISKKIYLSLKKDPCNVKLKSIPGSLHKYVKEFQKTKSSINFLEDRLNYTGNCIQSISIPNTENKWILMMTGGNVESVVLHSLKPVKERYCQFKFETKPSVNHSLSGGYGFQLSTVNINDKVMCCVRQATESHLLALENSNDEMKLKNLETLQANIITDIKPSPYIESEFVYGTKLGSIAVHNSLYKSDLVREEIKGSHSSGWTGCNFGAHPRCITGFQQDAVYLWDTRASHRQSFLQLLRLPSVLLSEKDQIYISFKRPCNPFQHFVATTNSLILIDERYPSQMVFKWSHLLPSPPVYYNIQDILSSNNREEVILLSSYDSQNIAMIHTQNSNKSQLPISMCPVLHLSTPDDIPDYLQTVCFGVSDKVKYRLQVPLIGICSLMSDHKVASAPMITVIQKTLVGDLFYQDFSMTNDEDEVTYEKSWKYGPGCTKTQMDSNSIEKLKKWILEAEQISQIQKEKIGKPEKLIDGIAVINGIKVKESHLPGCSFCCNCSHHDQPEEALSDSVCPACGIPLEDSAIMKASYREGRLFAGTSKFECLYDYFYYSVYPTEYKDSVSQNLFSVWTDVENINSNPTEISEDSFPNNSSQNMDTCASTSEFQNSLRAEEEISLSALKIREASFADENYLSDDLFSNNKAATFTSPDTSSLNKTINKRISFLKHRQNVSGF